MSLWWLLSRWRAYVYIFTLYMVILKPLRLHTHVPVYLSVQENSETHQSIQADDSLAKKLRRVLLIHFHPYIPLIEHGIP